jgi:tetratricopeptide (TPR) repeat protein
MDHLLSYAEFQFGDRIPGKAYRERSNGEQIDNWVVEVEILLQVNNYLASAKDESLGMKVCDNLSAPYKEKMIALLMPWFEYFNSNSTIQRNNLDREKFNYILEYLSQTERNLALIYVHNNEPNFAVDLCQLALYYARLYEGKEEKKIEILCKTLKRFSDVRVMQGNYADALILAEEGYNCAAIAYDPVHPEVLKAASVLIDCLIHKGDFYNAERFGQATLDGLKDPANKLDQQSEIVASGYYDLANVIYQQKGDFIKAEALVRESLRIRSRLNNNAKVGRSGGLLAKILMSQGELGRETKELLEYSLAVDTKNLGPEGSNTILSNISLGDYHDKVAEKAQIMETRKEHLLLSKSCYAECLQIYTKIYGPNNPKTVDVSSKLSTNLLNLSLLRNA